MIPTTLIRRRLLLYVGVVAGTLIGVGVFANILVVLMVLPGLIAAALAGFVVGEFDPFAEEPMTDYEAHMRVLPDGTRRPTPIRRYPKGGKR